jgi:hypothetical protein
LSLTWVADKEWDAAIQMLDMCTQNTQEGQEDRKRKEDIDALKCQLDYLKSIFASEISLAVALARPDLVPPNIISQDGALSEANMINGR